MAYLDLVAELSGMLPGLSPLLAEKYINRAWENIRDERNWHFLVFDGVVVCPTQITEGSASITQYQTTVTLDADASAAVQDQITGTPVPGLSNMAIRFGASSPAIGQVYNILSADNAVPAAVVLTLDRVVVEATNATSGYQIYRPYIRPPIADFKSWVSLADMTNAFTITGPRLSYTSAIFDSRDPQRQAQGLAYYLGAYLGAYAPNAATGDVVPNANVAAGTSLYELWPHPTSGQTFYVRFRRKGVDFTQPDEELPDIISSSLVLARALGWHAYPFAAANVANFPSFKGVNWPSLILQAKIDYRDELREARKNDEERALQSVWNRGHGLRQQYGDFKGVQGFPIDSNYLQSHLVRF